MPKIPFCLVLLGLCYSPNGFSVGDTDLYSLDLTQLMNVSVASAAKRPQALADAATAIYVISREDIRHSAATSIPELLHLAPGVEVARINGFTWAVTIRGFQSQYANKLLVLVDGRSVYTPLYSGVYWDSQMPMIDDIDQIEVIRGPGSSLWGSNAVNGVINIITKNSAETTGVQVTAGAGNVEQGYIRARNGGEFKNGTFRYYSTFRQLNESLNATTGKSADDRYQSLSVGARADWQNAQRDLFTLQGDYSQIDKRNNIELHPYVRSQIEDFNSEMGSDNANLLFRWTHPYHNGNAHVFQTYLDWTNRDENTYRYNRKTLDLDYQFNHQETEWHRLTWGLNYRWISDDYVGTYAFDLQPDSLIYTQSSGFSQLEWFLKPQLTMVLGIKLENTEFTDFEYQPEVRLIWRDSDFSLWGSVSRAVRTPSRGGRGIVVHNGVPSTIEQLAALQIQQLTGIPPEAGTIFGQLSGSENFESESVLAFELGMRHQVTDDFFFDATTYYNQYKNLRTFDLAEQPITPVLIDFITPQYVATVNLEYGNDSDGHSEGFELAANWNPMSSWQLKLSYTYFNFVAEPYFGETSLGVSELSDQSPLHQAMLRSWHQLNPAWEFDGTFKYYGALPNDEIKSYADVDIRLSHQLSADIDLALLGKNLFDSPRTEFQDTVQGPIRTEMHRSLYVQVIWRLN